MDKQKFSLIANRYLKINNPIGKDKLDDVISLLNLTKNQKIYDFGGGKGEFLISILEKYNVEGFLIEISKELIECAKEFSENRIKDKKINFINQDVKAFLNNIESKSIDCGISIGSTHAFGEYKELLLNLKKYLKIGGLAVIGQGYWKKEPDTDYLLKTGMQKNEQVMHFENIEIAEDFGFQYLYSNVADQNDWDKFEGRFSMAVEDYLYENPNDPDFEEIKKRIRTWRNAYLQYGRETFGFGLYLYRSI